MMKRYIFILAVVLFATTVYGQRFPFSNSGHLGSVDLLLADGDSINSAYQWLPIATATVTNKGDVGDTLVFDGGTNSWCALIDLDTDVLTGALSSGTDYEIQIWVSPTATGDIDIILDQAGAVIDSETVAAGVPETVTLQWTEVVGGSRIRFQNYDETEGHEQVALTLTEQ